MSNKPELVPGDAAVLSLDTLNFYEIIYLPVDTFRRESVINRHVFFRELCSQS